MSEDVKDSEPLLNDSTCNTSLEINEDLKREIESFKADLTSAAQKERFQAILNGLLQLNVNSMSRYDPSTSLNVMYRKGEVPPEILDASLLNRTVSECTGPVMAHWKMEDAREEKKKLEIQCKEVETSISGLKDGMNIDVKQFFVAALKSTSNEAIVSSLKALDELLPRRDRIFAEAVKSHFVKWMAGRQNKIHLVPRDFLAILTLNVNCYRSLESNKSDVQTTLTALEKQQTEIQEFHTLLVIGLEDLRRQLKVAMDELNNLEGIYDQQKTQAVQAS